MLFSYFARQQQKSENLSHARPAAFGASNVSNEAALEELDGFEDAVEQRTSMLSALIDRGTLPYPDLKAELVELASQPWPPWTLAVIGYFKQASAKALHEAANDPDLVPLLDKLCGPGERMRVDRMLAPMRGVKGGGAELALAADEAHGYEDLRDKVILYLQGRDGKGLRELVLADAPTGDKLRLGRESHIMKLAQTGLRGADLEFFLGEVLAVPPRLAVGVQGPAVDDEAVAAGAAELLVDLRKADSWYLFDAVTTGSDDAQVALCADFGGRFQGIGAFHPMLKEVREYLKSELPDPKYAAAILALNTGAAATVDLAEVDSKEGTIVEGGFYALDAKARRSEIEALLREVKAIGKDGDAVVAAVGAFAKRWRGQSEGLPFTSLGEFGTLLDYCADKLGQKVVRQVSDSLLSGGEIGIMDRLAHHQDWSEFWGDTTDYDAVVDELQAATAEERRFAIFRMGSTHVTNMSRSQLAQVAALLDPGPSESDRKLLRAILKVAYGSTWADQGSLLSDLARLSPSGLAWIKGRPKDEAQIQSCFSADNKVTFDALLGSGAASGAKDGAGAGSSPEVNRKLKEALFQRFSIAAQTGDGDLLYEVIQDFQDQGGCYDESNAYDVADLRLINVFLVDLPVDPELVRDALLGKTRITSFDRLARSMGNLGDPELLEAQVSGLVVPMKQGVSSFSRPNVDTDAFDTAIAEVTDEELALHWSNLARYKALVEAVECDDGALEKLQFFPLDLDPRVRVMIGERPGAKDKISDLRRRLLAALEKPEIQEKAYQEFCFVPSKYIAMLLASRDAEDLHEVNRNTLRTQAMSNWKATSLADWLARVSGDLSLPSGVLSATLADEWAVEKHEQLSIDDLRKKELRAHQATGEDREKLSESVLTAAEEHKAVTQAVVAARKAYAEEAAKIASAIVGAVATVLTAGAAAPLVKFCTALGETVIEELLTYAIVGPDRFDWEASADTLRWAVVGGIVELGYGQFKVDDTVGKFLKQQIQGRFGTSIATAVATEGFSTLAEQFYKDLPKALLKDAVKGEGFMQESWAGLESTVYDDFISKIGKEQVISAASTLATFYHKSRIEVEKGELGVDADAGVLASLNRQSAVIKRLTRLGAKKGYEFAAKGELEFGVDTWITLVGGLVGDYLKGGVSAKKEAGSAAELIKCLQTLDRDELAKLPHMTVKAAAGIIAARDAGRLNKLEDLKGIDGMTEVLKEHALKKLEEMKKEEEKQPVAPKVPATVPASTGGGPHA